MEKDKVMGMGIVKEVLPMGEFKEKYGKGVNLTREMRVENGELICSIRMLGRMLDVHDPELDRLQRIQHKTKSTRIEKKLGARMLRILEKYV